MSAQPAVSDLVEQLLALPDAAAQKARLKQADSLLRDSAFADALAESLKQQADHLLRQDVGRCGLLADLLLYLGELTDNPLYEALSLRVRGNILGIASGEFQQAINCYDTAVAIYQAHHLPVDAAKSQVGKIGCLSLLSRYDEAFAIGEQVRHVLQAEAEWALFIAVSINLAVIHNRLGQGQQALLLLDEAQEICQQVEVDRDLPGLLINRAHVLRNLGRLQESIQTSQQAEILFAQRAQTIAAARAKQSTATTYFFLGRFNEALALFDQVIHIYLDDERRFDALVAQLFMSDCLLQVGRYQDVLQRCQTMRGLFGESQELRGQARAILNEALAFTGLRADAQALVSLDEARALFAAEGNEVWTAVTDLEKAAILYRRDEFQASLEIAQTAKAVFAHHDLRLRGAQADLVMARAVAALAQPEMARQLAEQVNMVGELEDVPWLKYQAHYLLGVLAQTAQDDADALAEYGRALQQFERLRGRLMVEFRADFLEDKHRLYEDIVSLYLQFDQPQQALEIVERAKSRALVDMLAYQLDLRLAPRSADDQLLIAELQQLRDKRNQMVRRWAADAGADKASQVDMQQSVLSLEEEMTGRWHQLLIHNADYAHDAALMMVRNEPIQPYLDEQTLLIEYFIVQQSLIVFLVTSQGVAVRQLSTNIGQLSRPIRLLNVTLKAVPRSQPAQLSHLTRNTQTQLKQHYDQLIAPISDLVSHYENLIIVPHGPLLHSLPFHALFDGQSYLIERHAVSYLPSASLLHYAAMAKDVGDATLNVAAFGYSCHGRLPHAPQEAELIADLLDGRAFVEEAASLTHWQECSAAARVLHIASHGNFNANNPLFSNITLADGQLSTLDIFNLRLPASLVTLSACETGHSLVKGGDELLGLMRAFLYAGASSLVLSQWRVTDEATSRWMHRFYQALADGRTKQEALRQTQQAFLNGEEGERHSHPYYWAPFFLIGDTGYL